MTSVVFFNQKFKPKVYLVQVSGSKSCGCFLDCVLNGALLTMSVLWSETTASSLSLYT